MRIRARIFLSLLLASLSALHAATAPPKEQITTDILIVGGTESGWAAAIQAARLGVKSITVVHDGEWLGGQYTEQGLACVDENKGVEKVGWGPDWHPMKRSFHRFGLFKELMDRIEAHNTSKYGSPMPGKPVHGPSTFRPAEAEAVFREMLQPYIASGQVSLKLNFALVSAMKSEDGMRLTGVTFRSLKDKAQELSVRADLTIDASDWGEAVQLSGAAFEVGADPRSRYGEPSAQVDVSANPPNEMNPITWTMIIEESDDSTPIPPPSHYDERRYWRGLPYAQKAFRELKWDGKVQAGAMAPWPADGKAAARQGTITTMRRIVEGSASKDGRTSALLCFGNGQDYPLERLPRHVAAALEAAEPGASLKNIVLMTREQRQIIFDDVKAHSLGLLHQRQPRDLAGDRARLEEVRQALCGGTEGVPILLWPCRDLPANHPAFIAINRLAARGLLPMSPHEVDFQPDAPASDEWRTAVLKLCVDYDLKLTQRADDKFTRGEFARQLWPHIEKQSPASNKTP